MYQTAFYNRTNKPTPSFHPRYIFFHNVGIHVLVQICLTWWQEKWLEELVVEPERSEGSCSNSREQP